MYLEIVTPEAVIFSSEVDSVSVPGVNGQFQMLNNHAPIVSILKEGSVLVDINGQDKLDVSNLHADFEPQEANAKVLTLKIKSGALEMKDNKVILLAD